MLNSIFAFYFTEYLDHREIQELPKPDLLAYCIRLHRWEFGVPLGKSKVLFYEERGVDIR